MAAGVLPNQNLDKGVKVSETGIIDSIVIVENNTRNLLNKIYHSGSIMCKIY
jgi:hypothetical protein